MTDQTPPQVPAQATAPVAVSPLTIRFSEEQDAPAIYNFYLGNQHGDFDLRKPEVIQERAKAGQIIIVEKDGQTGMSSMGFSFARAASPDQKTWSEFGATRSVLNGMSLYAFIIASQVIQDFLHDTPAEKFFANVYEDNDKVRHLLKNIVGWNEFEPEDEILTVCKTTKETPANDRPRVWYESTSDTLAQQARLVSEFISKTHIENYRTQEQVPLDFSRFSLATVYKKHVEELAHGRFGEMLTDSQPLPLAQTRKAFENYLGGARYFPELSAKP